MRRMLARRDVRFVVVGGGVALAFLLLSWTLVEAGLPPFVAAVLAYGLSFVAAYLLQRNWTFEVDHSHRRSLPRYAAAQTLCAILAGLAAQAAAWLGASPPVMAITATAVSSAASYILSSRWVFRA